jgi:Nif-specific regulatory protein
VAAYLEVVSGRSAGRRYALAAESSALGRDEACEVSLLDESCSRRHAAVARRGDRFYLRDLGSRNGTFLNGAPLAGEDMLRSGDEIVVGASRLRFVDESERARDTAPLPPPEFRVERTIPLEGAVEAPAPSLAERRLRSLLALGRLIASADDPRALLEAALRAIPETLGADRAVAALAEPGSPLDLASAIVEPPGSLPSRALLERALAGGDALLVSAEDRAGPDARLLGRESAVRDGVRAVLAAPMPGAGARRGVLYVDRLRSGGRFDDEDLAFLAEIARQLGAALAALGRTREAREESEAWRRLATRGAEFSARRGRLDAGVIGESAAFRAALETAERAARSDAPVLLLGETGSGKEVFARLIHDRSARGEVGRAGGQVGGGAAKSEAGGAFIATNCAAIPESLLESELFGHEKGAFTGAERRRRGLFELARGGTLFLDEVGEMPASLQAKLLRALETREIRRLGGEEAVKLDLRVIAATNRELSREVEERRFREDLYYRLAVLTVRVPPLRERVGDAERLARHFLAEFSERARRPALRLADDALAAIRAARWPGNVRELRNAIERAVALAEGDEIGAALLGLAAAGPSSGAAEGDVLTIEEAERRAVVRALRASGGKKGEAARILGISHPTLNRKIREFGLNETFGGD